MKRQRAAELAAAEYQSMDGDQFFRLVKFAVAEQRCTRGLEAELARRASADMLHPREAYPVLTSSDPEWETSRATLAGWLAGHPEHAVTLVAAHARNLGMRTPEWEEALTGTVQEPRFSARAGITADGRTTWSATRTALRKDRAREQAALSLIAALASQPDPSADITGPVETPAPAAPEPAVNGQNPLMALNELRQAGVLTDLTFEFTASGPPHNPEFTCTADGRHVSTGQLLTAEGTAKTKQDAKTRAARQLLAGTPNVQVPAER